MMLLIDANILFSALIASEGKTRSLFSLLHLEFISPEFIERELEKHFLEIVRKSKCPEEEVRTALEILLSRVKILPEKEYEPFLAKAKEFSPDPKDAEYFAVALAFACPLWSNDKKLKEQGAVKVISTSELLQLLSARN